MNLFHKSRRPELGKAQETAAGEPGTPGLRARSRRAISGQSLVEAALVLPLIVLFLSVVIEGGLALNAWIRVNTAARDATRFALDEARPNDVGALVLTKLSGIDFGSSRDISGSLNIDVYQINGLTDANGDIPNDATHWKVTPIVIHNSPTPSIDPTTISNRIKSQSGSDPTNVPFVIVEVDFQYTPLLSALIAPNAKLPMYSYAIIQQQPNN
jgi:hypothetical protein